MNSLETVVYSWDATIKDSNAKASQAVSTANAANTKSAQAVSTANSANTKSDQAVKTANTASSTANTAKTNSETAVADALEAKEIAKEAKAIAEEAVVDSDADVATMRQLLAETKAQAQNASTSAAASQSSANESADYSTLSQAWAVKMDGKVTEGNVPDGTEVDYSSKYYAQQAKASADAADASEASALSSKNAAASSAAAAKTSETNSKASETAAKASQDAAAASASAAKTSETNALSSKNVAAASASAAKASEANAKTSETNAKTSETAASSSKSAAASSASAAKASETNAAASKTSAASSASAASTSATNAANSQKAAASSATSAANAQKAAEAARDLAQQYASQNAYAVVYDAQTLTTAQQAQARKNIGAISAAEAPAPDLTPYLTKADAASTYLGINAKAKTAGTADTVPWTGVSGKPNLVRSVNGISPGTDGNVTIPIPARMMPNYGSYVQIGAGDYTPSEDGWLRLENMNSGDYTGGKVIHKASGALILEFYQNRYPGNATMMLPVRAGETYTVSNPGRIYFHKMM